MGRVCITSGLVSHIVAWYALAVAEQPSSPAVPGPKPAEPVSAPAPALPSEEGIEEAQPPLWYLKDKDGKLKPALGWTPEVLEELWQIKAGLKQQEQIPRFAIQWMSGAGTAKGDFAELKIELKILVRDEHGVRIPLRLNQAILREGAQYEGSGQQSVQFEESGDGYVCFIRGGAGEVHRLTLNVLVPLSRIGSETRLKLSTPRGADWEMKLRVPGAGVVARASEGATLLAPSSAAENVSELIALGHGGDLELAWRKAGDPPAQGPSVLEAVGEILAKADGRTIRMEAKLNVRGYGSPFDRLRVRLPKGAVLAAAETADYTVRPVSKEAAPPDSGQVVEVQLAKETVGPEEIRLNAEIAHEAASESPVELAGFEVLGAARQWGYVGIHVAGDWHIRCEANRHIRQVEALPERLRSENVVAGFEYFRQPFSLTARVVPRETRISVEPEYLLLIEATQVQLRAKLKYTVRGAKAFGLNVELPRWQLDEVGPENLVSVEGVQVDTKTGLLSIPLSQPTVGQIEVVLRAKLPIRGDEQPLLLELPRPQATSLGPAAVVVLPADNVELVPDAESTTGLVRQQIVPNLELPQWQQEPLFYRTDGVKSQFATVVRVRSRRVSVAVSTHVAVEPQKAKVEQKLGYLIAYEPTDRLDLEVPRGLAAAGRMQVSLGDQTLSLGDVPDADEPHGQDAPVRKRVALPSVRIGVCELVVRYSVDLEEPKSGASVINTIPLVMPADGELTDNTLLVTTAEALRAQHRQGPWRVQEDGEPGARRVESLSLSAPERVGQIVLNIIRRQYNLSGSTTVSRAWIQTWLVGQSRQDRAVFQFTSDRENLEVVIPAGVNLSDVDLRLDGRAISGQPTPTGQIVVPLGSKSGLQPRRLEVYYHFGRPRPGTGTLSVELPRLGPEVWVRRMYWQLVLPPNEHVIVSPSGFTPEYRWEWHGWFLGRQPVLDQAALETWSGAQPGMEAPASANCYLFSSLGTVKRCELRTTARSLAVLAASGAALVAGLLLIYVPPARHPFVLLLLAIGLAAVVIDYPGPALLVGQAASLGVVLAFLALLLQRAGLDRRRAVTAETGSSLVFEKGSTQVQYRPAPQGNHDLAETAPAGIPSPVSDSHV